jgi:hypothetical protein
MLLGLAITLLLLAGPGRFEVYSSRKERIEFV